MHYSKLYNPVLYVAVGDLLAGLCLLTRGKYSLGFGKVSLPVGVVLSYLSLSVFFVIALASAVSNIRRMQRTQ